MGFNLEPYKNVLLTTTREDVIVKDAKGFYLTLETEKGEVNVLDGVSQVGANPLGHRYEPLLKELRTIFAEDSDFPLMVAGNDYYHPYQKQLAEKFTQIYPGNHSPGDLKPYYCNSGSEAVERGCLKAAQLYKGGNSWIGFLGAFHGRTALALSFNFSKAAHTEGYKFLQRVLPAPYPQTHPERFNKSEDYAQQCVDYVRELIMREGAGNISAIAVEPIQGEGGYLVPPKEFLPELREIATKHDIPLFMDEVQSALRTGHWFASEGFNVEPDMVAVAKSFSGGLTPFGAALIKDRFANEKPGKQSSTFGGNPKECFTALKTIQLIEKNNFLKNARVQGEKLANGLEQIYEDYDIVKDHRGKGLMRAIEIQNVNGEPDAALRDEIYEELIFEHGVLLHPCGHDQINPSIRFLPSVNIGKEEVEKMVSAVNAAVQNHA